jgi:hypothetical protein
MEEFTASANDDHQKRRWKAEKQKYCKEHKYWGDQIWRIVNKS